MSANQLKTNKLKYCEIILSQTDCKSKLDLQCTKYTLFRLYLAVVRNSVNNKLLMKTCLKSHFGKYAWATIKNNKLFIKTCKTSFC